MAELSLGMEMSSKHLDQIWWLVTVWHCRLCWWWRGERKDAPCFLSQSIPAKLLSTGTVCVAPCCRHSGSQQGLYKALLGLQNLLAPFQLGSGDINRRMSHFWSLPSIHGKEELCWSCDLIAVKYKSQDQSYDRLNCWIPFQWDVSELSSL